MVAVRSKVTLYKPLLTPRWRLTCEQQRHDAHAAVEPQNAGGNIHGNRCSTPFNTGTPRWSSWRVEVFVVSAGLCSVSIHTRTPRPPRDRWTDQSEFHARKRMRRSFQWVHHRQGEPSLNPRITFVVFCWLKWTLWVICLLHCEHEDRLAN